MKKKISIILAILLILGGIVSLVGCEKEEVNDEQTVSSGEPGEIASRDELIASRGELIASRGEQDPLVISLNSLIDSLNTLINDEGFWGISK